MKIMRRSQMAIVAVAAALALSACSSDSDNTTEEVAE